MNNEVPVTCPYCFEELELWLDPGTEGHFVQDCEVCCRPWAVFVQWSEEGEPFVTVDRAQ